MPTRLDYIVEDTQLYIDISHEISGATKLADNILYANIEPSGVNLNSNLAVSFAKIWTWAHDIFDFSPSGTDKIMIKTSAIPSSIDTTYAFQEGTTVGAFQVKEGTSAWQTIAVHGVPTVDGNGKILQTFLPSYVDDVIEAYYDNGEFYSDPTTHTSATQIAHESGKIYVDITTNTSYRWGGSSYILITNPIDVFTGATAQANGVAGIVPAPLIADKDKFLKGDGTWTEVEIVDYIAGDGITIDPTSSTEEVDVFTGKENLYENYAYYSRSESGGMTWHAVVMSLNTSTWLTAMADEFYIEAYDEDDNQLWAYFDFYNSNNAHYWGTDAKKYGTHDRLSNQSAYLPSLSKLGVSVVKLPNDATVYSDGARVDITPAQVKSIKVVWVVSNNARVIVSCDISDGLEFDANDKLKVKLGTGLSFDVTHGVQANAMVGATSQLVGASGTVPTPYAGDENKFLKGDGTWDTPATTLPIASGATLGGIKVGNGLQIDANGVLSIDTSTTPIGTIGRSRALLNQGGTALVGNITELEVDE